MSIGFVALMCGLLWHSMPNSCNSSPPRPAAGWLVAGEVAHDYAVWMVSTAAGERNVAEKQAALLEAGVLPTP